MRVRTEFFVATFEELRDFEVPPEGPGEIYPTVETDDVDVALLWDLCRIASGSDLDTFLKNTHLVAGPESPGDLDKPTIELLPPDLIETLTELSTEEVMDVAERWAEVPEWRGRHSPESLVVLLLSLASLANLADETSKLMFLWTSIEDGAGVPAV